MIPEDRATAQKLAVNLRREMNEYPERTHIIRSTPAPALADYVRRYEEALQAAEERAENWKALYVDACEYVGEDEVAALRAYENVYGKQEGQTPLQAAAERERGLREALEEVQAAGSLTEARLRAREALSEDQ